MNTFLVINILIVFLFGAIVGLSELLNRYPETKYIFKPGTFLLSFSYVLFNGGISILSIFALWNFKNIDFSTIERVDYGSIFFAGLGGMAMLRSSFFSIEINDQKVDVGFVQIIRIFLDVINRRIRNTIAPKKLKEISEIVKDVDFEKLKNGIVTLSTTFTNRFTKEESEYLQKLIDELSTDSSLTNKVKMLKLGSEISKFCDADMLKAVINILNLPENNEETVGKKLDYYIERLNNKQD